MVHFLLIVVGGESIELFMAYSTLY